MWFWYPDSFESYGSLLLWGKWVSFPNRWKISASISWLYVVVENFWSCICPEITLRRLSTGPRGRSLRSKCFLCGSSQNATFNPFCPHTSVAWSFAHSVCLPCCVPSRKAPVPTHTWTQRALWKCALFLPDGREVSKITCFYCHKLEVVLRYSWPWCQAEWFNILSMILKWTGRNDTELIYFVFFSTFSVSWHFPTNVLLG